MYVFKFNWFLLFLFSVLIWCGKEVYRENRYRTPFLGKDTCVGCLKNDQLYSFLPDTAPEFHDVFKPKRTCAIVTYSKCLYQHSYGSLIDSNDVVLRFNLHPYENATAHGTKTTHMMVNDAFWFSQSSIYGRLVELRDLPEMVIFNHFASDWNCAFSSKRRYFMEEVLKVRQDALILDPLFIQSALVASRTPVMHHNSKASSGWTGMYLLTKFCGVINAFGFCPDLDKDYQRRVHQFPGEHERYYVWSQKKENTFELNMYPSPL